MSQSENENLQFNFSKLRLNEWQEPTQSSRLVSFPSLVMLETSHYECDKERMNKNENKIHKVECNKNDIKNAHSYMHIAHETKSNSLTVQQHWTVSCKARQSNTKFIQTKVHTVYRVEGHAWYNWQKWRDNRNRCNIFLCEKVSTSFASVFFLVHVVYSTYLDGRIVVLSNSTNFLYFHILHFFLIKKIVHHTLNDVIVYVTHIYIIVLYTTCIEQLRSLNV